MVDLCVSCCRMMMLVLVAMATAERRQQSGGPLLYQLVEEQPAGTFIADLRRDSNLSLTAGTSPSFSLLTASPHLRVDPDTGVLSTLVVIDRDVLCPGQSVCQLPADFVVRPEMHFHRVTVDVVDLNDNSPTFPRSHVTMYVSEATLPGQLLFPVQSAYDVDSPRYGVVGYRLVEGSTGTSDAFSLAVDNTATGGFDVRVVLRQPLDRELRNVYQIVVSRLATCRPIPYEG